MAELSALLDRAEADPAATIDRAHEFLDNGALDDRARSIALRAWGTALRVQERVAEALDVLDHAVTLAERTGDSELVGEVRTSRAAALFQHGSAGAALRELDDVLRSATGGTFGFALFQRASVMLRFGRYDEAIADLTAAQAPLERAGAVRLLAHALSNRGMAQAFRGDLVHAERDLRDALARYETAGLELAAADTVHNLGFVAHRRGELLEALRRFADGESRRRALGVATVATELAHAKALLDLGLATEAAARAQTLAEQLTAAGADVDGAEALLVASAAESAAGRLAAASLLAERAATMFEAHGRTLFVRSAQLVALRCRVMQGPVDHELLAEVTALDRALARSPERRQRDEARVLLAEALLARQEPEAALTLVGRVRSSHMSVEVQARLHAARAHAHVALGHRAAAGRAVSRGLARLDALRADFSAVEVRAAVGTHAEGLQHASTALGLMSRRPWSMIVRTEATRAGALRFPTGHASADVRLAEAVAELRALESLENTSTVGDPNEGRKRALQVLIGDIGRTERGGGGRLSCPSLAATRSSLGGARLVSLAVHGDALIAVSVGSRVERHELGSVRAMRDAAGAIALDLRRLARPGTSERSRKLASEHVDLAAAAVDEAVRRAFGSDDRIVLVPPATLLGFPWALLPCLRSRSLAVSPSVSAWFDRSSRSSGRGPAAFVAGPGLAYADIEVAAVAACWPSPTTLVPSSATTARVLAALDGAAVAHIAAHHVTNRDNPLFSAMRFADGMLYGHELSRFALPPHTVVLSVCEGAQSDHIGDETLGTAIAFLASGSTTVVAASSLLPDSPGTRDFMVDLHRALASGSRPADALASARRAALIVAEPNPAVWASLTCYGA